MLAHIGSRYKPRYLLHKEKVLLKPMYELLKFFNVSVYSAYQVDPVSTLRDIFFRVNWNLGKHKKLIIIIQQIEEEQNKTIFIDFAASENSLSLSNRNQS